MQKEIKRVPKRVFRRGRDFFISCEDKSSIFAIFSLDTKRFTSGWCDTLGLDKQESSWLELLVLTGISKDTIRDIISCGMPSFLADTYLNNEYKQ